MRFLGVAIALAAFGGAEAQVVYDASLNTLPTAQGWTLGGLATPAPTVAGGIFYGGLTDYSGSQYFIDSTSPFDFTSSTSVTADLYAKMDSSTYWISGSNIRTGFNFALVDQGARFMGFGLAANTVVLSNLGTNQTLPFDTTNGFHRYTMTVQSGVGKLWIDGNLALTEVVGSPTASTNYNSGYWGDTTGFGNYQGEVGYAKFGTVPEPASLIAVAGGALALLRRRRDRRA